jgi:hypothetical protein
MSNKPYTFARKLLFYTACILLVSTLFTGCEDEDDFSYSPAGGFGALIIDNYTDDDISVFVDGTERPETKDSSWKGYDVEPGLRRLFLEQQGGDHAYIGEIDILEGRKTIVDVYFSPDSIYLYEIRVSID